MFYRCGRGADGRERKKDANTGMTVKKKKAWKYRIQKCGSGKGSHLCKKQNWGGWGRSKVRAVRKKKTWLSAFNSQKEGGLDILKRPASG